MLADGGLNVGARGGISQRACVVTSVCLSAVVALIITDIYLYSQNTIARNGKWINTKRLLTIGVTGSERFFSNRLTLHGNRLNLGAWHSFNEATYLEVFSPKSIRFRFRLEKESTLSVIFNRQPLGYSGVRLSRNQRFNNMFFRGRDGEFKFKEPLKNADIGEGWHYCALDFDEGGLAVRVDGGLIGVVNEAPAGAQIVSFRNGFRQAQVDDFEAVTDKNEIFRDAFSNTSGRGRTAAKIFGAILLVFFPVLMFGIKKRSADTVRKRLLVCIAYQFLVIFFALLFYAFDYFYWSRIYLEPQSGSRLAVRLENYRKFFFDDLLSGALASPTGENGEIPDAIRDSIVTQKTSTRGPVKEYILFSSDPTERVQFYKWEEISTLPPKKADRVRVVFIGTSQSWGSGADSVESSLVGQFHEELSAALSDLGGLETLNLSISGATPSEQFERYRDYMPYVNPDVVVVNLSHNGPSDDLLERDLRGIVNLSQLRGAKTFLVKEPNSNERETAWLIRRHERVRTVGIDTESPVFDLHGFMNSEEIYDSGFLWWDWVHLSTYGQKIAAKWLASEVAPDVREALLTGKRIRHARAHAPLEFAERGRDERSEDLGGRRSGFAESRS